jgi:hypothetical protein
LTLASRASHLRRQLNVRVLVARNRSGRPLPPFRVPRALGCGRRQPAPVNRRRATTEPPEATRQHTGVWGGGEALRRSYLHLRAGLIIWNRCPSRPFYDTSRTCARNSVLEPALQALADLRPTSRSPAASRTTGFAEPSTESSICTCSSQPPWPSPLGPWQVYVRKPARPRCTSRLLLY